MPDPNLGQTVAMAWEAIVKPDPEDNIFEDYFLLNRFKRGQGFKTIDGGRQIEVPLEYATNPTVASYSDLEVLSTTRADVVDVARFSWKEYGGTVVQSELEDAINQGSGGKFPLLATKLANLKKSFEKSLNEGMFSDGTGNSSKDIGGLALIVDTTPATGTVGEINAANFSFWRNIQAAGTQTTAAYDNLRAAMRSVYNQCSNGVNGDHPTIAITTRTVFEGYEGLLLAGERYTDKSSGDGGFKNEVLKFKGAELAYDNDCTSATLYFLNPRYIKLCVAKGRWMKMMTEVEPANQTARVFRCVTIANMVVTNRRMLGVVSAIS
jgi:hypothetical protein